MTQTDKALAFAALHTSKDPLVLYNIWDAGSAKTVADAGAKALATGSWSVAAAQGYGDGEDLPLDFALMVVSRITQSTDLPVSVDFEGGYSASPDEIKANVAKVIKAGAIGVNFEDQVVGTAGLYALEDQVARIKAVRNAADDAGIPLFINARTDVFLKAQTGDDHANLMEEAKARQAAYANAGANGFFAPGLNDETLVRDLCAASSLPVNVLMMGPLQDVSEVGKWGVSRMSFGPGPYRVAQEDLGARVLAL